MRRRSKVLEKEYYDPPQSNGWDTVYDEYTMDISTWLAKNAGFFEKKAHAPFHGHILGIHVLRNLSMLASGPLHSRPNFNQLQLRLVVCPIIYKGFTTTPARWLLQDFWTINSITLRFV